VSAGRATASGEYLLDNRAGDGGQRFAALSALFDPVTFRHATALGIAPGWRCWEVGAGGPSLPTWLADRVGPDGHVVATDIEPSGITAPDGATIDVRRHDVAHDEPPGDGFDLVHARLVLVHVADRDEAIRRMVASLRPGGRLLIEDFDVALQPLACPAATGPDQELANRIRAGFVALLAQRGVDLEYGRKLPGSCVRSASRTSPPTPTSRWRWRWARRSTRRTSCRFATGSWRRVTRPARRSTVTWPRWRRDGWTSPCRRWCRYGVAARSSRSTRTARGLGRYGTGTQQPNRAAPVVKSPV
jgi:SAM-dependent methyltransferase